MPRAAMVRAMVCSALWLTMATCHRGWVRLRRGRRFWWLTGWMDVCGCQTFDCRRLWCPWRVGFGRVGQYLLVRDSRFPQHRVIQWITPPHLSQKHKHTLNSKTTPPHHPTFDLLISNELPIFVQESLSLTKRYVGCNRVGVSLVRF